MKLLLPPSRTVRNAVGESAPIDHYTGTLYKALGIGEWSAAERRWALTHLLIHDKDAGIVAAGSWEPLARAKVDGPALGSSAGALLVDARSGEYVRRIPPPPSAFSLRVVSEGEDGRRLAISHWNKLHKGVLAASLVRARPRVRRIEDLLEWARSAEIRLERVGERALDLVVGRTGGRARGAGTAPPCALSASSGRRPRASA